MSRSTVRSLTAMLLCPGMAGCYDLGLSPFQEELDAEQQAIAWVQTLGGSGGDSALVDVDPSGEIAVAGIFQGEAAFGRGQDGEVTLDAGVDALGTPRTHGYLARFQPSGKLGWVEPLVADGAIAVNDVVTLGDGNLAVVGDFNATLTFGASSGAPRVLSSDGPLHVFLARFDHRGAVQWAQAAVGSPAEGQAVAVDAWADLAVAVGSFGGDASFGGDDPIVLPGIGGGKLQAFVAAYDEQGELAWVRQTDGEAGAVDVAIAGDHAYVTGWFRGTTTFGAGEAQETTVEAAGAQDVFIADYDLAGGDLHWVLTAGGSGTAEPCALGLQGSEALVVAGRFEGSASFGTSALTTNGSNGDLFVARYRLEPAAAPEWAKSAGGAKAEHCTDVAVREDGSILVAGGFAADETVLGEGANQVTLVSGGYQDGLIACYRSDGQLDWARRLGGSGLRDGVSGVALPHPDEAILSGGFDSTLTFGLEDSGPILASTGSDSGQDAFVLRLRTDHLGR